MKTSVEVISEPKRAHRSVTFHFDGADTGPGVLHVDSVEDAFRQMEARGLLLRKNGVVKYREVPWAVDESGGVKPAPWTEAKSLKVYDRTQPER